jgi:hypothetical protein
MSNTLFASLFAMPAIPAEITGKNDVAIKGGNVMSILFGDGNTPQVRGAALLAAIAESAFDAGGKAFQRLAAEGAKGNKRKIITALQSASLPACKGGKNPRHLTADEVQAFLNAFAANLGEKKEAAKRAAKLPDVSKFLETYGKVDAMTFAAAIMSACGGVLSKVEPLAPVMLEQEAEKLAA